MSDWNGITLQWLNDFAEVGILTTDTDLNILSWNRWLEIHSGFNAAEMIGRHASRSAGLSASTGPVSAMHHGSPPSGPTVT